DVGWRSGQRRPHALAAMAASCAGLMILAGPNAAPAQQPTEPAAAGLEEVVVTARRREENLQTVPMTVTAFSQEDIRHNSIESLNDLQYAVPSMTLVNSSSRDEQFAATRGISG